MTDIPTLRATYERIKSTTDASARFAFGGALLYSNAPEYLDYHYSLLELNDCSDEIFALICRKFSQRGDDGERYLLERIKAETDDRVRATVLQILGGFRYTNGKYLPETLQHARSFLAVSNPELRLRALWVMGWLGTSSNFDQLAHVLHGDQEPKNRGSAATAMMQIFFNDKNAATNALAHLENALSSEADLNVLEQILISIQEISGKKLGLSANAQLPADRTKVEQAKCKAVKLLISDARK